MTPRQIVTLTVRLLAVIWLLRTIAQIGAIPAYLDNPQLKAGVGLMALLAIGQIIACLFIWLFPAAVAAKLLPSALTDQPPNPASAEEWQALGFACIGLWELARAVPDAAYWITVHHLLTQSEIGGSLPPRDQAQIVATIVELGIGLWLLLGSRRLTLLIRRLRTAGHPEQIRQEP